MKWYQILVVCNIFIVGGSQHPSNPSEAKEEVAVQNEGEYAAKSGLGNYDDLLPYRTRLCTRS